MYLKRKPSAKDMERGIKLIEAVYDQLRFYSDGMKGPPFIERYPDWRNDYGDYKSMLWAAKRVISNGSRHIIESVEKGGMADSQILTSGHIEQPGRYKIDYWKIFEKAVDVIHEREKRQRITEEEINSILSGIEETDDEGFRKAMDYIRSRTPRSKGMISSQLRPKWERYFETRRFE